MNKEQAFFRPATPYKGGYHVENQGLVFLKFVFLICGTLLYKLRQTIIAFLALVEIVPVAPFAAIVALVALVDWLPSSYIIAE